jgi:hypothetical protein
MQSEPSTRMENSDEINLADVLISVFDFFRRNFTIFLIFNILGIALGLLYFFSAEKVYSSRFTGECMLLPDGRTIELINDLDGLRKNEDWSLLGKKLGISADRVRQIKEILPLPNAIIDKESRGTEDYAAMVNPMPFSFSVMVKVSDNGILPDLQKGMVNYLSENQYNKIRVARFVENRKNLITSIDEEIRRLDSLFILDKAIRYKSVSNPESKNEITYKDLLFELHEKKEKIEDELRFALPVRVIQEFTAFRKPVFPILWQVLLAAFVLSNMLSLSFIAFKNIALAVKTRQSENL